MISVPLIIQRYVDAYNAMDIEMMLDCLSIDVRFVNRMGGVVTHSTRGIDSFRNLAQQTVQLFVKREQTIIECIAIEDRAALRVTYSAIVRYDLDNGWRAGQTVNMNGVSFLSLEDHAITEIVDAS
jgi:predicted ester cyclase